MVLTDAANHASAQNAMPNGLLAYLGISRHREGHHWFRMREELLDLALHTAAREASSVAEGLLYAMGKRGQTAPLYLGFLLRHQSS